MSNTGITWLHLSDWHQGKPKFNMTEVRDALLKDILERDRISPDLKQINFVVFSGDVAWSGKQEEYDAVWKDLFEPLLNTLKLTPQQLFVVPGNHDLDRSVVWAKEDSASPYPKVLKKPFESEEKVNKYLYDDAECSKYCERLLQPFNEYNAFIKKHIEQSGSVGNHTNLASPPKYSAASDFANTWTYSANGIKVSLLGINSALMAGRNKKRDEKGEETEEVNDYGFLVIGKPQIHYHFEKMDQDDADVRIAIMHHPFEWLTEFDRNISGASLRNKCHFILCGHQHSPDFIQTNGIKGDCIMIPAGASYERGDYRNGYNFVHLDFLEGSGTVYLRRWSRERVGGKWIKDEDSCDNGEYKFDLINLFNKVNKDSFEKLREKVKLSLPRPTSPPRSSDRLTSHYRDLISVLLEGKVVPFLGADINLCDRPEGMKKIQNPWKEWNPNGQYPPTNLELAAHLDRNLSNNLAPYLEKVGCPLCDSIPSNCPINTKNISRLALQNVSQYFSVNYKDLDRLKVIVDAIYKSHKYKFNSLHEFLASLPGFIRDYAEHKGNTPSYPLIVTTCFDNSLEHSFIKKGQPFDLVSYCGDVLAPSSDVREKKQSLVYFSYQKVEPEKSNCEEIEVSETDLVELFSKGTPISQIAHTYTWLTERPVILRLYGPGNLNDTASDNTKKEDFAITENHFVNYFSEQSYQQLPSSLLAKITNDNLLFLGYSLSYWNLRGIVHRLHSSRELQKSQGRWWAVQEISELETSFEKELWASYGVDLLAKQDIHSFEYYIAQLQVEVRKKFKKLPKPSSER